MKMLLFQYHSSIVEPQFLNRFYRNMHFVPVDFASFTNRILKNAGIEKTVNATAPFGMGSIDITGFDDQKSLNICWIYPYF